MTVINMTTKQAEDKFNGAGIRIKLKTPDDFNKIRESLTRIGVPGRDNTLWQSCHILHRQGEYAIMHFKEMFEQDGKPSDISEDDYARRNRIALLLEEWNLCDIVDKDAVEDNIAHLGMIKVLTFAEKSNWTLKPKYVMRSDKKRQEQKAA